MTPPRRFALVLRLGLLGAALLVPACGRDSDDAAGPTPPSSIEVTPTVPSAAQGTTRQLAATGLFSGPTALDLTAAATWSSSNDLVATVNQGMAMAVAPGTATLTATYAGVSGSTLLTVTAAALVSIEVTPFDPVIAQGTTLPLAATGFFSDGTKQDLTATATWASGNDMVATVSDLPVSKGLAAGIGAGTTSLTATFGVVSGLTTPTVNAVVLTSLDITPTDASIARGTTRLFVATGTFSDGSTQDLTSTAAWSSSNDSVATVSRGLAAGVTPGLAIVTATVGAEGDTTSLTVTAATLVSLDITPADPTTGPGRTQQFTTTGTFSDATTQDVTTRVIWSSAATGLGAVSNASGNQGLATGVAPGVTTITATSGLITDTTTLTVSSAALVSIAVTPASPLVAAGAIQPMTATGTFADASTQDLTAFVTWSSSDTTLVWVSNAAGSEGRATAGSTGTATVTATFGAVNGSTPVTVP